MVLKQRSLCFGSLASSCFVLFFIMFPLRCDRSVKIFCLNLVNCNSVDLPFCFKGIILVF